MSVPHRPVDSLYGGRRESIEAGLCARCGALVEDDEFDDAVSREEYQLSGFCQKCQDWVFQEREEL